MVKVLCPVRRPTCDVLEDVSDEEIAEQQFACKVLSAYVRRTSLS